jgi:hypothetical protein
MDRLNKLLLGEPNRHLLVVESVNVNTCLCGWDFKFEIDKRYPERAPGIHVKKTSELNWGLYRVKPEYNISDGLVGLALSLIPDLTKGWVSQTKREADRLFEDAITEPNPDESQSIFHQVESLETMYEAFQDEVDAEILSWKLTGVKLD